MGDVDPSPRIPRGLEFWKLLGALWLEGPHVLEEVHSFSLLCPASQYRACFELIPVDGSLIIIQILQQHQRHEKTPSANLRRKEGPFEDHPMLQNC